MKYETGNTTGEGTACSTTSHLQSTTEDGTPQVRFNLVRHPSNVLVKRYRLIDGRVIKEAGGKIPKGCTVTTIDSTLGNYAKLAHDGGPCQYALPTNTYIGKNVPLTLKNRMQDGAVHRGAEVMHFEAKVPAVITFDYDPNPRAAYACDKSNDLWRLMEKLFPDAFVGAAHVGYVSSSSYIYLPDGAEYSGSKGHHTAFAVEDAEDVPRFSEALFRRLWLNGYGHIYITRSGILLARTIFDSKVMEAQQPLFAGGAHCEDGMEQRRPAPSTVAGGYVRTKAIHTLSPKETTKYMRLLDEAKRTTAPEADRVRREYLRSEVQRLVASGMNEQRAHRMIESRFADTLIGDDVLIFAEHGCRTVADVLADPSKYDECNLHDPVEPEYGSAQTAIFFANEATNNPLVYSHAHGGRKFKLRLDENTDSIGPSAAPEVVAIQTG